MSENNSSLKCICSFCNSKNLSLIIDFGDVALAGGFLKKSQFKNEKKYPLRVFFCNDCFAVQVTDKVPADVLFNDYFYFSSSIKTLKYHFQDYAKNLIQRFKLNKSSAVLEFGCNDGVLLKPLAEFDIGTIVGVDPATNVIKTINDDRLNLVNNYFTKETSNKIIKNFGKFDLIMANNVYAHIEDIQDTTKAVKNSLKADGVFVFEVHYLGKVIDELQYDMIYHEHLYYYSVLSAINHFKQYDLKIFDIEMVQIHSGSIRFYVCNNNSSHSNFKSVFLAKTINEEKSKGYDKFVTFEDFSNRVKNQGNQLSSLLNKLRKEGKKIAGYGASGRANTMIQSCNISNDQISYIIDDAPAKLGFYTPGSHIEICSSDKLKQKLKPDYILVFAWSFLEEIKLKNKNYISSGGKFIIPLPKVTILN